MAVVLVHAGNQQEFVIPAHAGIQQDFVIPAHAGIQCLSKGGIA
jgi:hypothetical protein